MQHFLFSCFLYNSRSRKSPQWVTDMVRTSGTHVSLSAWKIVFLLLMKHRKVGGMWTMNTSFLPLQCNICNWQNSSHFNNLKNGVNQTSEEGGSKNHTPLYLQEHLWITMLNVIMFETYISAIQHNRRMTMPNWI